MEIVIVDFDIAQYCKVFHFYYLMDSTVDTNFLLAFDGDRRRFDQI